MKKVIFLVVSALMAFFMSGCAGKQVEPNPVYFEQRVYQDSLIVSSSINSDSEKVSATQKLAVVLKKAAEVFKEKGYKYFYIEKQGFPSILTDIKSVDSYCFPEHNGFHVKETKSTSLENGKCSLEVMKQKQKIVSLTFFPLKEVLLNQPTWSVEEILNDKNIDKYIEAALEDGEFENKTIRYISDWKEYDKIMNYK